MTDGSAGLVQSVQARLVRHAKALGVEAELIFTRFAVERFLFRLSRSRHAERFVLKGALLLLVWLGETIRATRDVDLLGFGDLSDESLAGVFREICAVEVEPDGMAYLADSIRIATIRPEDAYAGKRVILQSRLGPARLRVQADIGIGDAVIPEAEWLEYPSLLGFPRARLRAYLPETMIAEKVHALVVLGSKNSRMRDFYDVDALARRVSFDGRLAQALRATFERRRTPIPIPLPHGLTKEFAASSEKRAQWAGFLKKNGMPASEELGQVVERLARFLAPVFDAAGRGTDLDGIWTEGGPWQPRENTRT
jgi:predicted nucleotidyltransferase component of viral defense system